jgi:hypothetical protein
MDMDYQFMLQFIGKPNKHSLAYRLAIFCLALVIFAYPCSMYAGDFDLSSILIQADQSYRVLTREDIEMLMSFQPPQVIKEIRKIYGKMNCKKYKNVPSQWAIAYLGLFGDQKDAVIVKNVWTCDNLHSKELLPCEYYCAYKFALDLFDIRFKKRAVPRLNIDSDWPMFANKRTSSLQVDSIGYLLEKLTEEEILQSLRDKTKRPTLPTQIIEGLTDVQINAFYKFAVYYRLAQYANKISTRDELFKELLYLYFRDASGDGGVNNLQQSILLIEERRR